MAEHLRVLDQSRDITYPSLKLMVIPVARLTDDFGCGV
jgi:hypothetical protein